MCRSIFVAPKRSGKVTPTSKTVNSVFFLFAMRASRRHVSCVICLSQGGGVRLKRHCEQPHAALGPVARSRATFNQATFNQATFNRASLSRVAVNEGALIEIAFNKIAWETA